MESHHLHVSPSCESPLEHPPLHERGIPSFNKLEELFPGETMEHEEEDPNLQWLSIFVEDCLSSNPTPHLHLPPPQPPQKKVKATNNNSISSSSIPVKQPRSKRRRTSSNLTYPSLLHQPHWLAESELLLPKERLPKSPPEPQHETGGASTLAPKRCSHCQSQKTPQWREGPEGPKTLCNACGVRFKKGRLLPEYRPAKSPTFQSCKHSNSHKKVMEMRMMAAAPLLSQGSTM